VKADARSYMAELSGRDEVERGQERGGKEEAEFLIEERLEASMCSGGGEGGTE